MAESETRIEIGFSGGGTTQVVADSAQWDQLQAALTSGTGEWTTVTLQGNETFMIRTSQVVFARVAAQTRAIGFRDA
jgi:hypothetical protein